MTAHIVVGYTATKAGRDAVAFGARLARATGAVLDVSIVLPSADRSVITPPADGYSRVLRDQAQHWIAEASQSFSPIHSSIAMPHLACFRTCSGRIWASILP